MRPTKKFEEIVFNKYGEIDYVIFKGKKHGGDGNTVHILISELNDVRISDIPKNVGIQPVSKITSEGIYETPFSGHIYYIEDKKCGFASIEIMHRRKYWDGILGLSHYMNVLSEAIKKIELDTPQAFFEDLDDDSDYIFLRFGIRLDENMLVSESIKEILRILDDVYLEADHLMENMRLFVERSIQRMEAPEEREKLIRKIWKKVLTETDSNKKGVALEKLIKYIVVSIDGFDPVMRIKTGTEEIDISVRNESKDGFWEKQSPYILWECKNWSGKVGKDEIVLFRDKLDNRFGQCNLGFLVSVNGFSGTIEKDMLRGSKKDILVVPIDRMDLEQLVSMRERSEFLKKLVEKAIFT